MRIATSEFYSSSLSTMESQQAQLLQVEQQASSGVALSNPADDPVGAAQAVQLSSTSATLTQYASNQTSALTSLQTEDSTLSSVATTLQAITGLAQQAMNGTVNDTNRASMAQEMQGYLNQLVSLANTTDGTGNAIFAGFKNTTQAFTNQAGGVTYNGDSGQRLVQVTDSRQVAVGDTGQSVFMSVQALGSQAVSSGSSTNTGTGTIGAVTVTSPTATTNNDNYSIAFSGAPGSLTYQVTDNSVTPPTTTAATPYTDGGAIALGAGLSVTISGTPSGGTAPAYAAGDTFSVSSATAPANSNVFTTISNMITALNTPAQNNPTAMATMTNALTTGMTQLGNSLSNVITVQASVGGREQELKALQTITSTNALQTTTSLNSITSTDMTAALTQYTQLQNALSASQKTFVQTQGLSLFQYINP